ncbi:HAMP domain-containing histidine kinase [Roseibacterium beibuensis]|nr:HAMP domain-containing histidine kinase [Roseibacterium beibuensis]
MALLVVVVFDIDRIFDVRYTTLSGLAFEIGDHVVLPFLVLILPIFVAIPWLVRSALAPLELAAERVDSASGMDRGFRVEVAGLPAEATPFVQAVNNLLQRLDESAERHEGFAADVAHELKTPLAILQLELDSYGDPLARKIRADIAGMNKLVEQLLLLAQLDEASASRVLRDRVELHQVAAGVISSLAPRAIDEGVELELELVEEVAILGRHEAIAAALRNLIENSMRVTRPGVPVTVLVGPGARLRVRDGGPGVDPLQLEHLKRRHCRAGHPSSEGAGLGLAIASRIMASHGGRLETSPTERELQLIFERS